MRGGQAGRNHHIYRAGLVQPVDPPSQHPQALTGGFEEVARREANMENASKASFPHSPLPEGYISTHDRYT